MELDSSLNCAHDETEIDNSKNIVNKRRSSVFQRRSIAPEQQDADISGGCAEVRKIDRNTEFVEEPFDLAKYISSLKDEREMWKKTWQERKLKRRRLAKQASNIPEKTDIDLSILTKPQRDFIQARPNYEQISKDILNLKNIAIKGAVLNAQVNDSYNELVDQMNQKILNLTKRTVKLVEEAKEF